MRFPQKLALLGAVLTLGGCRRSERVPDAPMPPHTVLLSAMMRELSAQPGFTENLIHELDQGGKKGPALLTPDLADELRKRILGKDWKGLDRFPGWTMRQINPTVGVVGHLAGNQEDSKTALDKQHMASFLDLGPYPLDREQRVAFTEPSPFGAFTTEGIVKDLGDGVILGDGPNNLAPEHAESQRLADMLNRLSINELKDAQRFEVMMMLSVADEKLSKLAGTAFRELKLSSYDTPEDLIRALQATGHTVTITDSRYFANFGHLHYKGEDVMMPFWIDTQIAIPDTGSLFRKPRPLLAPVAHAEYEWHIRGPLLNADVSWYFGIDGKAEWRTMDTLDQAWVLKRDAHTYTGDDAIEVTRLTGLMTLAYMRQHVRRPELPFGGYYALGVCQDSVSAIEHKMTGTSTLFPNTADSSLFDDPQDGEVNALIAAIPKDRLGVMPTPERVFGSLPTEDFNTITIPGLAEDLRVTHDAWQNGVLERTHSAWRTLAIAGAVAGTCVVFMLFLRRRRQGS